MDTLTIQRSLTILEERYRKLRETGNKYYQDWKAETTNLREKIAEMRGEKEVLERELTDARGEKEGLERELTDMRGEKEGLERELTDVREDSELLLLQLHQVQKELEYYFFENQRKDEKLDWLRAQRESLLRMLGQQARLQQRFITLDARTAFALRGRLRP